MDRWVYSYIFIAVAYIAGYGTRYLKEYSEHNALNPSFISSFVKTDAFLRKEDDQLVRKQSAGKAVQNPPNPPTKTSSDTSLTDQPKSSVSANALTQDPRVIRQQIQDKEQRIKALDQKISQLGDPQADLFRLADLGRAIAGVQVDLQQLDQDRKIEKENAFKKYATEDTNYQRTHVEQETQYNRLAEEAKRQELKIREMQAVLQNDNAMGIVTDQGRQVITQLPIEERKLALIRQEQNQTKMQAGVAASLHSRDQKWDTEDDRIQIQNSYNQRKSELQAQLQKLSQEQQSIQDTLPSKRDQLQRLQDEKDRLRTDLQALQTELTRAER